MRKYFVVSAAVAAALMVCSPSEAQDRAQCCGTAAMYEFGKVDETPAPRGYKPFYISHYGRHGARWCTSSKPYDAVMHYLQMGHDSLILTGLGEEMYTRYLAVYPLLKGTHGDLSSKGEEQHRMLADRMVEAYPEVFRKNPVIDARASIVPRAIVSMAAFCTELQKDVPAAQISVSSCVTDLIHTNPVSEANPYMDAGMYEKMMADARDAFRKVQMPFNPKAFAQRLFSSTDFLVAPMDYYEFENSFYDTAAHMQCVESPDNLEEFFTDEEFRNWWKMGNYQAYAMMRTPQYRALSFPLVRDFVDKVEEDAADGVDVRLRFGHDMVLMSLLGLLEIDGWGGEYESLEEVCSNWKNYEVPMASNLRMVLYSDRKGDVLAKFMYNEKEVRLPLESAMAPYYSWEDLKQFLLDKAEKAENILKTAAGPDVE